MRLNCMTKTGSFMIKLGPLMLCDLILLPLASNLTTKRDGGWTQNPGPLVWSVLFHGHSILMRKRPESYVTVIIPTNWVHHKNWVKTNNTWQIHFNIIHRAIFTLISWTWKTNAKKMKWRLWYLNKEFRYYKKAELNCKCIFHTFGNANCNQNILKWKKQK